jgi:hypothetical protein
VKWGLLFDEKMEKIQFLSEYWTMGKVKKLTNPKYKTPSREPI